uniref:Uncharacterized protein n=1 Tax=Ascaris lumbricoides TaxID=6252 RepID=A0A9J2PKU0_ASCLU
MNEQRRIHQRALATRMAYAMNTQQLSVGNSAVDHSACERTTIAGKSTIGGTGSMPQKLTDPYGVVVIVIDDLLTIYPISMNLGVKLPNISHRMHNRSSRICNQSMKCAPRLSLMINLCLSIRSMSAPIPPARLNQKQQKKVQKEQQLILRSVTYLASSGLLQKHNGGVSTSAVVQPIQVQQLSLDVERRT